MKLQYFILLLPEILLLSYLTVNLLLLTILFSHKTFKTAAPWRVQYALKEISISSLHNLFVLSTIIFCIYFWQICEAATFILKLLEVEKQVWNKGIKFFNVFDWQNCFINKVYYFNDFLVVHNFSQLSKLILSFIFASVICLGYNFILFSSNASVEFTVLLGFSFLFCLLLLSVFDFFLMYFLIESLGFVVSLLIATNYKSSICLEAAIKYFIISSLSSGFIIFSVFWVYAISKSTKFFKFQLVYSNAFYELHKGEWPLYNLNNAFIFDYIETWPIFNILTTQHHFFKPAILCFEPTAFILLLPVCFLIIAFLIKLGVFPFSMWSPDVYEGSPNFIMLYLAVNIKITYILLFIKILYSSFEGYAVYWQNILLFCATGSFFVGAFGAYGQQKLKRFFAYASINQLGFILLGLCCTPGLTAIIVVLFFTCLYALNNILFFSVLLSIKRGIYGDLELVNLSELKGFSCKYPFESCTLSIALFSFIGVPPLMGFFSKFFILVAAAKSGLFFEVIVALFCSGVSSFYYLRIIKFIWFDNFCRSTRFRHNPRPPYYWFFRLYSSEFFFISFITILIFFNVFGFIVINAFLTNLKFFNIFYFFII